MIHFTRRTAIAAALATLAASLSPLSLAADPIKIGLVTALSGQSAQSGEAITRGLTVAIDEINAKGGLLGAVQFFQRVQLHSADHRVLERWP